MATHDIESAHHAPVHEHAHPTGRKYVGIAVVLTIITAVEVAIFYIPMARGLMMFFLAVLAITKFVMVVGWYMHLRFDAKLLTWLFVAGLITATATITGLWALFNGWGG